MFSEDFSGCYVKNRIKEDKSGEGYHYKIFQAVKAIDGELT